MTPEATQAVPPTSYSTTSVYEGERLNFESTNEFTQVYQYRPVSEIRSYEVHVTQGQCFFRSEEMAGPKVMRAVPLESYSLGHLINSKKFHDTRGYDPIAGDGG